MNKQNPRISNIFVFILAALLLVVTMFASRPVGEKSAFPFENTLFLTKVYGLYQRGESNDLHNGDLPPNVAVFPTAVEGLDVGGGGLDLESGTAPPRITGFSAADDVLYQDSRRDNLERDGDDAEMTPDVPAVNTSDAVGNGGHDTGSGNTSPEATPGELGVETKIFFPSVEVHLETENQWSTVAANPQRTSWTDEEISGSLDPLWYRPIEPYILPRVQIIAANGMLFISTAKGLYTLDVDDGSVRWIYPTAMPLGNSPTIYKNIAYVGGFDRKIHAVDALTGQDLWTFEAGGGFDTNPLIVNDMLYAGNRDGYFYALHVSGPNTGELAWKFQTQGPIHYSAAYKDEVVFFASDDSHAYALNAHDGELVWKSAKLPGAGFHSFWPVIYRDWVVFAGSHNYTNDPGIGDLLTITRDEIYPYWDSTPRGTLVGPLQHEPGDWADGTLTLDTSQSDTGLTMPIVDYYEQYPWRRTYFVLNRATGVEYTTDFDQDGNPEYAPILPFGAKGTNTRYPPIVGSDGVIYQMNDYASDTIPGGQVTGWKIGTPFISIISNDWGATDEPHTYSGGGNMIYWKLCCDRQLGTIDISKPNQSFWELYLAGEFPFGGVDKNREWSHVNYNMTSIIPGYNVMTYEWETYSKPYGGVYGGWNGVYGWHGDDSPPVPYGGKIFTINSNAVVAFAPRPVQPQGLPLVPSVDVDDNYPPVDEADLKDKLSQEVQKILDTGHLRPVHISSGLFDHSSKSCGDRLVHYWHHPGDMLYALIRALPYLPPDQQAQTRAYLQNEFSAYPPYQYDHIGFQDGADRQLFIIPPEVAADMAAWPPQKNSRSIGWDLAPHSFYALWKYAQEFGDAEQIYLASKDKLEPPPANSLLVEMPQIHNAYIAGYLGYLELEALAGYPESSNIRQELNRLLLLRVSTFSKDAPASYFEEGKKYYCRALNVSRNFMYLVPELAQYLHDHALNKVQNAIAEYLYVAPYWFVPKIETAFAEGVTHQLRDTYAIFQAKAWILGSSQAELAQYLDVPAVNVGDLFYLHKLVSILEAAN